MGRILSQVNSSKLAYDWGGEGLGDIRLSLVCDNDLSLVCDNDIEHTERVPKDQLPRDVSGDGCAASAIVAPYDCRPTCITVEVNIVDSS
jgi:hypothetical protein